MGNVLTAKSLLKFNVLSTESISLNWIQLTNKQCGLNNKIIINKNNPCQKATVYTIKQINNLQQYLLFAQFRFENQQKQIVGVYGIYNQLTNQKQQLCNGNNTIHVVLEYIPYRFSDLGQISFKNAIFIIKSCVKGCQLLKSKFNIFPFLDQNMICFNDKRQCKIWMNQNIQQNHSQFQQIITEAQCIKNVFVLVQQKTIQTQQFYEYINQKDQKQFNTFQQMFQFLQNYPQQPLQFSKNQFNQRHFFQNNFSTVKRNKTQKKSLSLMKKKKVCKTEYLDRYSQNNYKQPLQILSNRTFYSTQNQFYIQPISLNNSSTKKPNSLKNSNRTQNSNYEIQIFDRNYNESKFLIKNSFFKNQIDQKFKPINLSQKYKNQLNKRFSFINKVYQSKQSTITNRKQNIQNKQDHPKLSFTKKTKHKTNFVYKLNNKMEQNYKKSKQNIIFYNYQTSIKRNSVDQKQNNNFQVDLNLNKFSNNINYQNYHKLSLMRSLSSSKTHRNYLNLNQSYQKNEY